MELLFWIAAAAGISSIWIWREIITSTEAEIVLVLLFALLCFWIWTSVIKSRFRYLVLLTGSNCDTFNPVHYSNIHKVFEAIDIGDITVNEYELNMLKSLRRAMYFGPIVLVICLFSQGAIS